MILRSCLILVALVAFGCPRAAGQDPEPRPNLLFISLDTVRADHCSVYGYDRDTTPNLDALARNGVIFERAYAPTATTGPSHSTMFTGLYPITHGVVKNGLNLSDDFTTLAERLNGAGYVTGGVASSFVMDHKFGYGQGFAVYDDQMPRRDSKADQGRPGGPDGIRSARERHHERGAGLASSRSFN